MGRLAHLTFWLLVLSLLVLTQNSSSFQKLSVDEKNYIIYEFQIKKQSLPHFLQTVLKENNIIESRIRMGFNKRQDMFEDYIINPQDYSKKYLFSPYPSNGIQIYIQQLHSTAQQIQRFRSAISSLLSISANAQFMIAHPLTDQLYISNPNDKLCSQQIHSILMNFLPCRSNSGLGKMLTTRKILLGGYIGIEIVWQNEKIYIKFMVEHFRKAENGEIIQTDNLLDMKLLDSNTCPYFDTIEVVDKDNKIIGKGKNILSKLKKSIIQYIPAKQLEKIQLRSKVGIRGNWYGEMHLKKLIRQIQIQNQFSHQHISQISITQQLPLGFEYKNSIIQIYNSQKPSQQRNYQIEKTVTKGSNGYTLIILTIHINSTDAPEDIKINSIIEYTPNMASYEDYLLIAGGGQQFMRIPVSLKLQKISKNSLKDVQYVYVSNDRCAIADHLPEPDFSIPFQVIAFAALVIGYTWIGIWRIYFAWVSKKSQIDDRKQKIKTE